MDENPLKQAQKRQAQNNGAEDALHTPENQDKSRFLDPFLLHDVMGEGFDGLEQPLRLLVPAGRSDRVLLAGVPANRVRIEVAVGVEVPCEEPGVGV